MRRLLFCLLAAFACGSAFAAPVDYQFFAFVTTRHTDSSAKLPAALTPNTTFIGTLTYDPAHKVNDAVSPVLALRLTDTAGNEIFNSASRPVFSSVMTRLQNGVESALIGADIPLSPPDSLNVQFSWASPGQGQLPANPAALDILALRPYGWKFSLVNTPMTASTRRSSPSGGRTRRRSTLRNSPLRRLIGPTPAALSRRRAATTRTLPMSFSRARSTRGRRCSRSR